MKRDDDYIRALLLEAEESDDAILTIFDGVDKDDDDTKRYVHANWLVDSGYFQRINTHTYRMTNQGNDYLASIRDDTIWTKTKSAAATLGGVSLGVMKDIAVAYVKQEASTRLGLSF